MLGLYVHIPFCARRCPYCDFAIHVGAKTDFVAEYCAMLRRELQSTLDAHSNTSHSSIDTIFFGGGTPTALESFQLEALLRLIRDHAPVADEAEISIEANPDGLNEEKLAVLRQAGWNRLSLGAQSFDDETLKFLGRTHRAAGIEAAFAAARRAGFDNISLDLIFAVPGRSRDSWRESLRHTIALHPEHVSCYSLTIEEGTAFARRRERGRLIPVVDDEQAELMQETAELLANAGLERYEVSNYARPGRECRHNLNTWRGGNYLACGCGAHGHLDGQRWWNERDAMRYVAAMRERGSARVGQEALTPRERLGEIVMLGLRLREGFSLDQASHRLGLDARRELNVPLNKLIGQRVLYEVNGSVRLLPEAMPLVDAVAARLMP